jgi:hypothetical protein
MFESNVSTQFLMERIRAMAGCAGVLGFGVVDRF